MHAKLNDLAIEVRGIRFTSRSKLLSWYAQHLGNHDDKYVELVDGIALMCILKGVSESIKDNLISEVDSKKARYSTPNEACYSKLFGLELPIWFGSTRDLGCNQRVLPRCNFFFDFDTMIPVTSFCHTELENIKHTSN